MRPSFCLLHITSDQALYRIFMKFGIEVVYEKGPGCLNQYSDSLRAGRSGDRIPVGGRDFLHPSRPALEGGGAIQPTYTTGTGSFPGVKRPGRGVNHPPLSSAEVEGRVELYTCSLSGLSWPVLGLPLPLPYLFTKSFWTSALRERWLFDSLALLNTLNAILSVHPALLGHPWLNSLHKIVT